MLMIRTSPKLADKWIKTISADETRAMIVDYLEASRLVYEWLDSHNCSCIRGLLDHEYDSVSFVGAHRYAGQLDATGKSISLINTCEVTKKSTSQLFEIRSTGMPPRLYPVSNGAIRLLTSAAIFLKQSIYYEGLLDRLVLLPVVDEEKDTCHEFAKQCEESVTKFVSCRDWLKSDLDSLSFSLQQLRFLRSSFVARSSPSSSS